MKALNRVICWLQEYDGVHDRGDVKADLASCYDPCGFEFAKNLETIKHWCCDAALVAILDDAQRSEFCDL
jgi:hypothetical protein